MYNEIEMHTLGSLSTERIEVPVLTYKIPLWAKVVIGVLLAGICYLIWRNWKKDETIKEKDKAIKAQGSEIFSQRLQIMAFMPDKRK